MTKTTKVFLVAALLVCIINACHGGIGDSMKEMVDQIKEMLGQGGPGGGSSGQGGPSGGNSGGGQKPSGK